MNVLMKPKIQPNEYGLIKVPNLPGLGVDIDSELLNEYLIK